MNGKYKNLFYNQLNCKKVFYKNFIKTSAERKGFEPPVPLWRDTRFPSARLKPLGHLSLFFLFFLKLKRKNNKTCIYYMLLKFEVELF